MNLLLLDRDGVINEVPREGSRYILDENDLVVNQEILKLVVSFQDLGGMVAVVTNQQCIGKGLLTPKALDRIHEKINAAAMELGGTLLKFFVCPHLVESRCNCRKPQPGLIRSALRQLGFLEHECIFIGDQHSDYLAALAAKCSYLDVTEVKKELELYDVSSIAIKLRAMEALER